MEINRISYNFGSTQFCEQRAHPSSVELKYYYNLSIEAVVKLFKVKSL